MTRPTHPKLQDSHQAGLHLALFQPDIPQNVGAAMRLCACLGVGLEIIEPCGFPWDIRKIRQAAMDYIDKVDLTRHESWTRFKSSHTRHRRLILLTTKTDKSYLDFSYKTGDTLILGRESAGVPQNVHEDADCRITIPMEAGMRSLNVINAAAIIVGEAKRQLHRGNSIQAHDFQLND